MIFIAKDLCNTSIQNKFSPIENEKVIELEKQDENVEEFNFRYGVTLQLVMEQKSEKTESEK